MSSAFNGPLTYLGLSTLVSNLISFGTLALPNYTSSREVIGCAAVAGATPLLFYILISFSLPSKANLALRLLSHSPHEPPYSNSLWLVLITTLSVIATVGRYSIASFFVSNIVPKHYGVMLPLGILKVIHALALLETYTILRIGMGMWRANQALREAQRKNRPIDHEVRTISYPQEPHEISYIASLSSEHYPSATHRKRVMVNSRNEHEHKDQRRTETCNSIQPHFVL